MAEAFSTIILAGGRGSRFGQEKASLVIDGQTLLDQVISRLARLNGEVIVVYSQSQDYFASDQAARTVTDIYPDKGALGGLYTGLVASSSRHNLIVACDMPFLNLDLLAYMIERSPSFDIVIPKIDRHVEPLHAVYSKNCLGYIEDMFRCDNIRILDLLLLANVCYVEESEVDEYDPERLSIFNINYQADLERAMCLKEALAG
jgi:molybdopterin-guanine dinucleotide biosynthesis protein A